MSKIKKTACVCKNCKWWFESVPKKQETPRGIEAVAECRRFPPTILHLINQGYSTLFPLMGEGAFCGEFKIVKKKGAPE